MAAARPSETTCPKDSQESGRNRQAVRSGSQVRARPVRRPSLPERRSGLYLIPAHSSLAPTMPQQAYRFWEGLVRGSGRSVDAHAIVVIDGAAAHVVGTPDRRCCRGTLAKIEFRK